MTPEAARRVLPIGPLEELLVPRLGAERRAASHESNMDHRATAARFADYCGVSRAAWVKYRRRGLSASVADRLAVRCGYHPCEVWGPAFYEAPDPKLRPRSESGRFAVSAA